MEIGPISAIRPASVVRPSPPGSDVNLDLAGVFAVELRDQHADDSYTPHQPERGVEDEEEPEETEAVSSLPPDSSVSFFA